MKKAGKIFSAFLLAILVLGLSVFPGFAAKESSVNGVKNIKKGDIISYNLKLGDCTENIVGFQMYIHYDKEYLDVVPNSLKFPELSGVIYNENSDNGIIFNYSDVNATADFSTTKTLASVDFKVKKAGKTEIAFFVAELYGKDIEKYFTEYTFTYDLAVNGEAKIKGEPPIIVDDEAFINKNQGQIINYVDGKGEKNGSGEVERETVVGVTQAPSTFQVGEEVTNEISTTTIIVLVIVIILCLAGIAIGIIYSRKVKNANKEKELPQEDLTEE